MNIYLNLKESCPKDWGNYSANESKIHEAHKLKL